MDTEYKRQERILCGLALGLGLAALVLSVFFFPRPPAEETSLDAATVWRFVESEAARENLDPEFVYALIWAESSLRPRARSPVARGMMQLTRIAWTEVTDESYRQAWDWKTNVRVGIRYLAFCRDFLKARGSFSYPLLAASYRYGPYHVARHDFEIERLKRPENKIYARIFDGDIRPVPLPEAGGSG